jgi:hypothetical protein
LSSILNEPVGEYAGRPVYSVADSGFYLDHVSAGDPVPGEEFRSTESAQDEQIAASIGLPAPAQRPATAVTACSADLRFTHGRTMMTLSRRSERPSRIDGESA